MGSRKRSASSRPAANSSGAGSGQVNAVSSDSTLLRLRNRSSARQVASRHSNPGQLRTADERNCGSASRKTSWETSSASAACPSTRQAAPNTTGPCSVTMRCQSVTSVPRFTPNRRYRYVVAAAVDITALKVERRSWGSCDRIVSGADTVPFDAKGDGMSIAPAKLLTAEQFSRLPDPPDGSKQELVRGEIITMPPPGIEHGEVQMNTAMLVKGHTRAKKLGRVAVA